METVERIVAVCQHCQREQKAKADKQQGIKLPHGWKREAGQPVCRACWTERYILRALAFPVGSPISGDWKGLEAALKPLWAATTQASNWMMTQCYARDIRRQDEAKMPPMPRIYLYPEARVLFPDLAPQTVASLEQAVQRKYRARRYEIVWIHKSSLPTMRYPQPYPVPNQAWRWWFNEQNQPMVKVRLGDSQWELRLKSGPRYYRQINGLKRMAEQGELAVYKANDGTMLVKLVGWLKREAVKTGDGPALIVRTGKDHLLAALDIKNERLWVENADQVARWIGEHRRQLQRWSEDQKAEQRPVPAFAARRTEAVHKFHQRIHSAIQEVAAHVANFAARRHYSRVIYDETERWLDQFPYAALQQRIKTNLDERQIAFELFSPPSGEGADQA